MYKTRIDEVREIIENECKKVSETLGDMVFSPIPSIFNEKTEEGIVYELYYDCPKYHFYIIFDLLDYALTDTHVVPNSPYEFTYTEEIAAAVNKLEFEVKERIYDYLEKEDFDN